MILSSKAGLRTLTATVLTLFLSAAASAEDAFEDVDFNFEGFSPAESSDAEFNSETDFNSEANFNVGDIDWGGSNTNTGQSESSAWDDWLWQPSRFTLEHLYGYKFGKPRDDFQNRTSFRVEYEKFFNDHYYLILDTKTSAYWQGDHLKSPEDGSDTRVDKAYLQASFGNTSVGLGIQTVSWGESQLSVITDVISPRDSREFANFNLEELRLGQAMVTLDQYSQWGRFSFIFIPDPKLNEMPRPGSPYYFFDGFTFLDTEEKKGSDRYEYGFRWGDTFGNSDFSVMAARLIDNDYAMRLVDPTINGWIRSEESLDMVGMTANYVSGKFLWKAELGAKFGKNFNDAAFQLVEKDQFDIYLGFEYTYDNTTSFSFDIVNQHIADWDRGIQAERNRQQVMFTMSKQMLNEDLNINFIGVYSGPASGYLSVLTTEYKWTDNTMVEVNLIYPSTDDQESDFWSMRDQRQISIGLRYHF